MSMSAQCTLHSTAQHSTAQHSRTCPLTWLVGMPSASAILCSSCATSMLPPSE